MLKHRRAAGFHDLISAEGAGQQVSSVLKAGNPIVRMRAIALVLALGSRSDANMKAVQQSGALGQGMFVTVDAAVFIAHKSVNGRQLLQSASHSAGADRAVLLVADACGASVAS